MFSQTRSFKGLLEAMPDALLGVDQGGLIQFVNRRTESLFGYDHDELLGVSLETLVPDSARHVHNVHQEAPNAATGGQQLGTDLLLTGLRRDGTAFPANVALSPMDTRGGTLVVAVIHDRSLNPMVEAERQHVNQLLKMAEYSDDAIIGTTLDGVITGWNHAAEVTFGYSSGEIIGESLDRLSLHDETAEAGDIGARMLTGEQIDPFLGLGTRKDGKPIKVSLSVSPKRESDGKIVGTYTIARDLHQARSAFEASRAMIEASLDSLVAISPEGKITDANEATVKLTGVSREKLLGTSFSDYFTDPKKAEEIYQRVFVEGVVMDYPLILRHHDGHDTFTEVRYNASTYRDDDGKVLGVFAAARDVTEQVEDQKKVAEHQAREMERLAELEQFQRLTVGRELKMIELKKEIEHLRRFEPPDGSEPRGGVETPRP
jgi:PAS domain S-box-containing protein